MHTAPGCQQWDIFCKVIDNFGDVGFCWRLSTSLAARGHSVRLWLDDSSALAWLAPAGCQGVTVLAWPPVLCPADLRWLQTQPCEVLVESFGCEIAPGFIAHCRRVASETGINPLWINLEYLSAEPYATRCHGLLSPVASGAGAGWQKRFFYPGFNEGTGGLLRECSLPGRQAAFDRQPWLATQGIAVQPGRPETLISLFCYEPPALGALLAHLAAFGCGGRPVRLLVTAGRASAAVERALIVMSKIPASAWDATATFDNVENEHLPGQIANSLLSISYLPLLSQIDFDHLLWACDVNFVRGEDSLVRALWAGKPLVWQLYRQQDGAHEAKLDAFLNLLDAPGPVRKLHRHWNALPSTDEPAADSPSAFASTLDVLDDYFVSHGDWAECVARSLQSQPDLVTQLIEFARPPLHPPF